MKKIIMTIICFSFMGGISAQTLTDALNFSQMGLSGSSNYISKAGAIGALGADVMSASYNPAGLGLFNFNEVSFSAGINWQFTHATSDWASVRESKLGFDIEHLGMVFTSKLKKGPFKRVQFTIGLNDLKNFGGRTAFFRDDIDNSFVAHMLDPINGYGDAYVDAFYEAYVLDIDTVNNVYTSDFLSGKFQQMRYYVESGGVREMTLSLSTNVQNFLYLGATVGIPFVNYRAEASFTEEKVNNLQEVTNYYDFYESIAISGVGINVKLGAIVRPVNFFRLGFAVHTPTYYGLNDYLYSEVSSSQASYAINWNPVNYSLTTPFRFLGSLAFILGDNTSPIAGTISADYEYADYSNVRYGLHNNFMTENDLNTILSTSLRSAHTIRVGAELKLGTFAVRAGFASFDNPFDKDINDAGSMSVTAGLGFKMRNIYLDLAYAYTKMGGKHTEYDLEIIDLESMRNMIQFTLGVRF